jgi:hypothetical protein
MTTRAFPTVVAFEKRRDAGKGFLLSGSPRVGAPGRHQLSFSPMGFGPLRRWFLFGRLGLWLRQASVASERPATLTRRSSVV